MSLSALRLADESNRPLNHVQQQFQKRETPVFQLRHPNPAGRFGRRGTLASNGNLWASVRAFLSQGKDAQGNYKPSLWFTVKAFTTKEGDAAAPKALQAVNKGEKFTIKGRLGLEEWADSEGNTRQTLVNFRLAR